MVGSFHLIYESQQVLQTFSSYTLCHKRREDNQAALALARYTHSIVVSDFFVWHGQVQDFLQRYLLEDVF